MSHRFFRLILIFSSVLLILFNTSCSLSQFSKSKENPNPQQTRAEQPAQQRAARGDNMGAAQEYLRLAAKSQSPQRDDYWMTAIEYMLRGKHVMEAKSQLSRLQSQQPQIRGRMQLAYAQIAFLENKPNDTLALLKQLKVRMLVPRSQISYYYLQALAYEAKNDTVQTLYARINLDSLLVGDAYAQNSNHEHIWRSLMGMPPSQLQQLPQPAPASLVGWATLAVLTHTTTKNQLPQAVQNWRTRYPQHPAEKYIVVNLLAGHGYNASVPANSNNTSQVGLVKHIALFLPLSSKFKAPAEMVRDGFITAWYGDNRSSKPSVKIYDVNESNVASMYQQALQKGAQMVVGPMGKNAATTLVNAYGDFPVPTLLLFEIDELNRPGLRVPKNLFQFSLSPEAEARLVAEKAWSDGHRLAAIVTPEGIWGTRLQGAFATHWERLGGQVVSSSQYGKENLTVAVREAANSVADVFFMASFPKQSRRIRPQFRYYGRGGTPLYATSHSYTAETDEKLDKDLNGVQFVDMPWILVKGFWPDNTQLQNMLNTEAHMLQPSPSSMYTMLQEHWPERMYGGNKRLFAFGIDAYHVIAYLQTATHNRRRDLRLTGTTGLLSLNQRGVVQRQLLWARFKNGIARLLPETSAEIQGASIPRGF